MNPAHFSVTTSGKSLSGMVKTYEEPPVRWKLWDINKTPYPTPSTYTPVSSLPPFLWPFQLCPKGLSCLLRGMKTLKLKNRYIPAHAAGKQVTGSSFDLCRGTNVFHCNLPFPSCAVLSRSERLVPVSTTPCRSQPVRHIPASQSGPVVNCNTGSNTQRMHSPPPVSPLRSLSVTPLPLSYISTLQETEQGSAGCVSSVQVIPPKVISLSGLCYIIRVRAAGSTSMNNRALRWHS